MSSHHLTSTKQMFLALLLFQIPFLKPTSSALAGSPLFDREPSSGNVESRIFNQVFGLGLCPEEVLEPLIFPNWVRSYAGYISPWKSESAKASVLSAMIFDKNHFKVHLDTQQFKPEEISVKLMDDDTVSIEAKHEEKQDKHGYISRHFVRRYVLPENVDARRIKSKLSSDGVLTISAPTVNSKKPEYKDIPIEQTKEPVRRFPRLQKQNKDQ